MPPPPKVNHERNDAEVRGRDRVLRHVQQLDNSSHSLPELRKDDKKQTVQTVWRGANTTTSTPDFRVKTNIGSVKPFPLPPQHQHCDIKGKKDAQSALNRASSQECKELIRNVTCLQQAGLLYDTDLRRECGIKTSGRKFEAASVPEDTGGPTAKIVFLFSLHGRAYRQVKRLFKAVYHRDHYYFVHIDSVSSSFLNLSYFQHQNTLRFLKITHTHTTRLYMPTHSLPPHFQYMLDCTCGLRYVYLHLLIRLRHWPCLTLSTCIGDLNSASWTASVAQWVELQPRTLKVVGLNHIQGSNIFAA